MVVMWLGGIKAILEGTSKSRELVGKKFLDGCASLLVVGDGCLLHG